MDEIMEDIQHALDAGAFYAALMATLTLPDVCSVLELPTGKKSTKLVGDRYKDWCARWFTGYPNVAGDELYALRCGVVHEARIMDHPSPHTRLVFSIPDARGHIGHVNFMPGAVHLDLLTFCQDMMDAVRRWYTAHQNDQTVQQNLPRLVRHHQEGYLPYIAGMPFIY